MRDAFESVDALKGSGTVGIPLLDEQLALERKVLRAASKDEAQSYLRSVHGVLSKLIACITMKTKDLHVLDARYLDVSYLHRTALSRPRRA